MGLKDLVADQLNAMLDVNSCRASISESLMVAPVGLLRAVYQNQLGLRIGEMLDLVHFDAEAVFPKQAGSRRSSRPSGLGKAPRSSPSRAAARWTLAPGSAESHMSTE